MNDLHRLRRDPHLSASGLGDYQTCSLKYRFSRVDRLAPAFSSSALVLGSALHRVLEDYYTVLSSGEILSDEDLVELFELRARNVVANLSAPIRYKDGETFDSLCEVGRSLISTFLKDAPAEDSRVVGVEQTFRIEVGGLEVPLIGSMDLVLEDADGVITVVDHKTASKAYSSADIDGNDQLTLYQLAAKELFPEAPAVILRLDTFVKTKKPRFEQHFTVRSEDDEQRLVYTLHAIWRAIDAGVFLPSPGWACVGCGYREPCNAWHLERAA